MNFILEIISGPQAGRRFSLPPGKVLKFGRTNRADVEIPDAEMSGLHFAIKNEEGGCRLRDAKSRNGTLVNDRAVAEVVLHDGDHVRAGSTEFLFTTSKEPPHAAAASAPAVTPRVADEEESFVESSMTAEATAEPLSGAYSRKQCDSGLLLFAGAEGAPTPVELATRLASGRPLFLIADFRKLEAALPEDLSEPAFLFDWYPEQLRAQLSPVLLGPSDPVDPFALIESGWGKNGIVCLFTQMPKEQLLERLRTIIRGSKPVEGAGDFQMFGFCWPAIVRGSLANLPEAPEIVADIDAVLVEGPDPETWQVYSTDRFAKALEKFGLSPAQQQEQAGQEET
jgi:hypothetical protein